MASLRGIHHFTYAIYPHKSGWQEAKTVHKGYELNTPLKAIVLKQKKDKNLNKEHLPVDSQLLNISADNLILMALKLSNNKELVMRCYEAYGKTSSIAVNSDLNLQLGDRVDCLGNELATAESNKIESYKIATWKLLQDKSEF